MEIWSRILRQAARRIRRNPLYSGTIILCLALGIGANTAIFSVVNTLLLRPLPVEDVDRLTFVLDMREFEDPFEAALVDYQAFRERGESFSGVGIAHRESFDLLRGDRPERLEAAAVTHDYLPTLGVAPIEGRSFTPEDDRPGAARVALIGHGLWQRRFDGDASIVGETLSLSGEPYTVVGILPPVFDLPLGTEVWVPLGLNIETLPVQQRVASDYLMVARLAPDASLEGARTEADALAQQIAREFPEQRSNWGIELIPLRQQLLGDINGNVQPALYMLLAVVGLLLLIACANVAGLLLVRSLERSHEVAVQTALGASRKRLVGELLVESVLLALAGGGVGLGLAYLVTPPLMALSPVQAFSLQGLFAEPTLDVRVLVFTLGVSLLTGVIFGLVPALRTALPGSLVTYLKEGGGKTSVGRGGQQMLSTLVVVEIAVAMVLLLGAALTVQSFQSLQESDLGFEPEGKLAVEVFPSSSRYDEATQRVSFVNRVLERLESLPGVSDAAMTTTIPLAISTFDAPYGVEGRRPQRTAEVPVTAHRLVTPGYLEIMGIELMDGRLLTAQDREGALRTVVISEELARRAWPDDDPLGKRLQIGAPPPPDAPAWQVVGVVDDVKEDRFNFGIDRPVWYLPYEQRPSALPSLSFVMAVEGEPDRLVDEVRQAIWEIDPEQPIARIVTLEDHVAEFLGPQRFSVLLFGLFAALGLVLAAIGLYGLLSYWITQSTREIGIRMALGAQGGDLKRLILGRGLRLTGIGLVVGLGLGWAVVRVLRGTIEQLQGGGVWIYVLPVVVLLGVALVAIYLPARRSTRIDPNVALRYE